MTCSSLVARISGYPTRQNRHCYMWLAYLLQDFMFLLISCIFATLSCNANVWAIEKNNDWILNWTSNFNSARRNCLPNICQRYNSLAFIYGHLLVVMKTVMVREDWWQPSWLMVSRQWALNSSVSVCVCLCLSVFLSFLSVCLSVCVCWRNISKSISIWPINILGGSWVSDLG